ncbi:glutathione peroxidase [Roseateles oligotrophus]|uniref:Glutathione peroxidase n=1 Tax=Roseateles oligotrophus TaxID=1769250 RepID=A0ABT2YJV3_9BURK|nr:glutathione peroxidase [Roseateles oligotrophus]MCV2370338.1 glutathione peroxidase [Roseateles oligotrophus]
MNNTHAIAKLCKVFLPALMACSAVASHAAPTSPAACPALLQREMPRLQDEKPQALCQYAGKVVLVVNTASFCGFTSQYKALEALAERYADRGLVVLGFPSNDFGSQEPGSNKEIAEFCENTFNVKFPMFAKSVVKAGKPDTNPLFADLIKRSGSAPKWNFHKYLISRDGQQVISFWSTTDPLSSSVTTEVERLLAKP